MLGWRNMLNKEDILNKGVYLVEGVLGRGCA